MRVAAPETLGEHVLHPRDLEHRAHARPGDDAGSGRGRLEHHPAGAEATDDEVGNRAAPGDRDVEQALLRGFPRLADRIRHLVGLAETHAHAPGLIPDRDDGVERESPPALHDLGAPVHVDHLLDELRLRRRGIAAGTPARPVSAAPPRSIATTYHGSS